jgi:hypothetical protein
LLVNNEISGSIPPDIQRYSNLGMFSAMSNESQNFLAFYLVSSRNTTLSLAEFLDLGNTVMEGTIPSEIGTLTSLSKC